MAGKLIRKVCFLNNERDTRILAWLAAQRNESTAIRQALEIYLEAQPDQGRPGEIAQVALDAGVIHQTVVEALGETLNLADIRRVVEAAIRSVLVNDPGLRSGLAIGHPAPPSEDDECDLALDDLDSNLVIG